MTGTTMHLKLFHFSIRVRLLSFFGNRKMYSQTRRSYFYSPSIVICFWNSSFSFKFRDSAPLSNLTTAGPAAGRWYARSRRRILVKNIWRARSLTSYTYFNFWCGSQWSQSRSGSRKFLTEFLPSPNHHHHHQFYFRQQGPYKIQRKRQTERTHRQDMNI